jgi:TonB family protein
MLACPASAQAQAEDWQLTVQGDTRTATVAYDNGLFVSVRCQDGGLETYIGGLIPDGSGGGIGRTVDYAFGGAALRASTWQINEDGSVIFADLPGPLARRFRAGGELQLRTEARGGQPARRYVVVLPPSPGAIDQVLVACGKPTVEPRDALRDNESSEPATAGSAPGEIWRRAPIPRYPTAALRRGVSGSAVVSCFTRSDGRLEDCEIEVERPPRAGFGSMAVQSLRDARLSEAGVEAAGGPGSLLTTTQRFAVIPD